MNKKRFIVVFTIFVLILSLAIPAMAAVEDTGYTDVKANAWYADAVKYCKDNGLMSGTTETTFSPNTTISRAMLATILYRQAGSPQVEQADSFSDVPAGRWYTDAVAWSVQNQIISGYNDGRFGPSDSVTREQIAAILWRAEGSPTPKATGDSFSDQATISAYAIEAVNWAHENEIISGRENNVFAPKGLVTRAEAATILQRYLGQKNTNTQNKPNTTDTAANGETAITITIGETVIPATLNDSTSAKELIGRLPLTVSMTRGSADYYASLDNPLKFEQADVHNGWRNGDIGFDSGGNYLTMFYAGEDTSQSHGNQITLGKISDLTLLDNLGSSVQATFALAEPQKSSQRTLVVYYSHSQRTKSVAELLQKKVNGDIYELIPAKPYTGSDNEVSTRATEEIESGNLPAFSGNLPDISQYDTILIGGPVWSYTVSAPILSYLNQTDFTGKIVAPFWTDQGGPGSYEKDFTDATKNAQKITDFLQLSHVPSISDDDMSKRLDDWLDKVID